MVKNWDKRTPDNFRFTAKFPKIITHDKKFKNVEKDLELFYKRMEPLKDKLLALLIQLPPSYKLKEGLEGFRSHDFSLYKVIYKQDYGAVVEYYCQQHFDKSDIK